MPFKSKAQQRYMFARHPELAKEWAEKTPDFSKLPERVRKRKKRKSKSQRKTAALKSLLSLFPD